jgi:hypothetical protein
MPLDRNSRRGRREFGAEIASKMTLAGRYEGGQSAKLNSEFSINSNANSKTQAAVRSVDGHWMFPMKTAKGRARKKN